MKRTPLLLIVFCCFLRSYCQIDDTGSGRAVSLDGVDDYIDAGNILDDLTFPFTVSAWVYLDQSSNGGPVLVSQDNLPIYNGFWFFVRKDLIFMEYGDGRGENLPDYRKGKIAYIPDITGRWTHATAVVRAVNDIHLYLNGFEVSGSSTGDSPYPMESANPDDVAKIGYFLSNGVEYHFKGQIDEIRLFNRSLTVDEIRKDMCRDIGSNTVGLIANWRFNETAGTTAYDNSSKGYHAQLKNGTGRIFSGAPIGDESVYKYPASWAGTSLEMDDLSVENVSGSPYGAHIYKVNSKPSQTGGLESPATIESYYGVFAASNDNGNLFDLKVNDEDICSHSRRVDNSQATWLAATNATGVVDRLEIVQIGTGEPVEIDLGEDVLFCGNSLILSAGGSSADDITFLWNTGETTNQILVTASGAYSVNATRGSCSSGRDTINVQLVTAPSDFSLGVDEYFCAGTTKVLDPNMGSAYEFLWNDGSTQSAMVVSDYGQYWVEISNECGVERDSIELKQYPELHVNLGEDQQRR
jgi:hypothetical protein